MVTLDCSEMTTASEAMQVVESYFVHARRLDTYIVKGLERRIVLGNDILAE